MHSSWAAGEGCADIAKMLLENGANVEVKNERGLTPLEEARKNCETRKNRRFPGSNLSEKYEEVLRMLEDRTPSRTWIQYAVGLKDILFSGVKSIIMIFVTFDHPSLTDTVTGIKNPTPSMQHRIHLTSIAPLPISPFEPILERRVEDRVR
jgi:hypothetical protein